MRPIDLWSYEMRRAGPGALAAPPALLLVIVLMVAFRGFGAHEGSAAWMLLVLIETGAPLVTGMVAASLIGGDRALELQLVAPTRYRSTLTRRLTLTLGWTGACVLAGVTLVVTTGWWDLLRDAPKGLGVQLTWLAPALWTAALGLLASVVLRSTAAATTLVAFLWLAGQLFGGALHGHPLTRLVSVFATSQRIEPQDWLPNRLTLLVTALLMAGAAWYLLGDPERVLGGDQE
ncbi:hypothetical protein FHS43_000923 [Streptosporangium becharense]|uniref:Uncharacterized protein n=1 Tax=Streptosporangium becharense TaxID=1816182 RepID=A0A7W9IET3_9ACTN|nr:hypothetical protein [Streptosporangium becharense]MBB2909677.1 hypothetical protein [Streptosporangium becharense]MBB5819367.1 hypothetical protein [Streptosporangium becharense]